MFLILFLSSPSPSPFKTECGAIVFNAYPRYDFTRVVLWVYLIDNVLYKKILSQYHYHTQQLIVILNLVEYPVHVQFSLIVSKSLFIVGFFKSKSKDPHIAFIQGSRSLDLQNSSESRFGWLYFSVIYLIPPSPSYKQIWRLSNIHVPCFWQEYVLGVAVYFLLHPIRRHLLE